MAEDLTEYLHENGIQVRYMHSDIHTLERIKIIQDLRLGKFDVLIGINLLREGLDIPECGLVAILDADKEGFLRSETSLIQTIGRAARNVDGYVILYADKETGSIQRAVDETNRRRKKQIIYNKKHNITPQTVRRNVQDLLSEIEKDSLISSQDRVFHMSAHERTQRIKTLHKEMIQAANALNFEKAAKLRDHLNKIKKLDLVVTDDQMGKIEDDLITSNITTPFSSNFSNSHNHSNHSKTKK